MNLGMSLEELLELATREEEGPRERALEGAPPRAEAEVLFREGVAHLKAGDHLLAAAHFLATTLLEPGHVKAWNNLGIAYFHLGRHGKAREAFERALALEPGNDLARRNLSLLEKIAKGGRDDGTEEAG